MFDRICILGPGLLGASIAIAAKQRKLANSVTTWSRRAETRAKCLAQSWCDKVADSPTTAAADANLIVICTPVSTIIPILELIAPTIASGTLITDVGSTKSLICNAAAKIKLDKGRFIGSHPMAGSDQTGLENARGNLFDNAVCFTTPDQNCPENDHQLLKAFWQALGMHVHTTSAKQHDAIVAQISHLPHLIASTLCTQLATIHPEWALLSGPGLRDATRIAGGDPTLWQDIFIHNAPAVLKSLDDFETYLKKIRQAIESTDADSLFKFLKTGQLFRQNLNVTPPNKPTK
jgi:prephenate dehydrogenase